MIAENPANAPRMATSRRVSGGFSQSRLDRPFQRIQKSGATAAKMIARKMSPVRIGRVAARLVPLRTTAPTVASGEKQERTASTFKARGTRSGGASNHLDIKSQSTGARVTADSPHSGQTASDVLVKSYEHFRHVNRRDCGGSGLRSGCVITQPHSGHCRPFTPRS